MKTITLTDEAAAKDMQRALFLAWQEQEGGVIDRFPNGEPCPEQTTTQATEPLPAIYDLDTGKLLAPVDPKTLAIDENCEAQHGKVVHVELAPDVAAQAVVAVALDDKGQPIPPKVDEDTGKIEQAVVLTIPDGKGGTVQVDGKVVDGVALKEYPIDLSAAVAVNAGALDAGAGELASGTGIPGGKFKAAARAMARTAPSSKRVVIAITAAASGSAAAAGLVHGGTDTTIAIAAGAVCALVAAALTWALSRPKGGA